MCTTALALSLDAGRETQALSLQLLFFSLFILLWGMKILRGLPVGFSGMADRQ